MFTNLVGFESALDTFFSQAYGAKNYKLMGVLLQRGFILVSIFYIPISILLFFTEYFLLLLGQEAVFARMTGNFVRILIPGYFPFLLHGVLVQFLNSQHIMIPNVVVIITENVVNALLNYLLIYGIPGTGWSGMGFYGSPLATSISRLFGFIFIFSWILIAGYHRKSWFGFQLGAAVEWRGLVDFFKIGIPGIVMLNLEAWVYVLGTHVPATFMGEVYIAANSIVLTVSTLNFMIPLGLGIAASVLVGNHVGEGDIRAAKTSGVLSTTLAIIVMAIVAALLAATHQWLPYIFTKDPAVIDIAAKTLLILAINAIPDAIQGVFSGIVRGVGKQILGASFNFFSYYVIGLPIGLVLAFVFKFELIGLYVGLIVAAMTSCCLFIIYLIFVINWKHEVEVARIRVGGDVKDEITSPVVSPQLDLKSFTQDKTLDTSELDDIEIHISEPNPVIIETPDQSLIISESNQSIDEPK